MAHKENDIKRTTRFSNRVENYVKYRPDYPQKSIEYLFKVGLNQDSIIADIGSGTGILSKLLVGKVHTIYAVEPNINMRQYAESSLSKFAGYQSVDTTAEETKLDRSSLDAITVAQAFHWFDRIKCKKEFKRILKPDGLIFLLWNNRTNNTSFLKEYDELLYKYATDYAQINHQNLTDEILSDFIDINFQKTQFDNFQEFSLEGFLGRVFSSSYAPTKDHGNYKLFLSALKSLFDEHNKDGLVRFNYKTEVYSGNMIM